MSYLPFAIGAVLALGISLFAALIGFDRDRAFYPVVLIVIASFYVLFAVFDGSPAVMLAEVLGLGAFFAAALAGFKHSLWWVVIGLGGHGVFDVVHGFVIHNTGVPIWWPAFCGAYDLAAAAGLAWLLNRSGSHLRRSAP